MKKMITLCIMWILLSSGLIYAQDIQEQPSTSETAIVIEAAKPEVIEEYEGYKEESQHVKLKITSGEYKGKEFEIENNLPDNPIFQIKVKKGDRVIVDVQKISEDEVDVSIIERMRQHYILYLSILFIVLLLLIGRGKGMKAVITLGLTMLAIVKILLPMILKGHNPVPITIAISILVTVITVVLISGINAKSLAAIIGTSSGVLIAGLLAYYIGSEIQLTGLSSEEAGMLMYIPQGIKFDFKGLLFSGIIMGALGAVMDIGMSISSAMEEIKSAKPDLTKRELFTAGMNVGKDIMGTMTNTLILAYTGSSIPLLLLFMAYDTPMMKILNLDIIATEIIRSLAGSIGLVLTIPCTAFIASVFMNKGTNKEEDA